MTWTHRPAEGWKLRVGREGGVVLDTSGSGSETGGGDLHGRSCPDYKHLDHKVGRQRTDERLGPKSDSQRRYVHGQPKSPPQVVSKPVLYGGILVLVSLDRTYR